MVLFITLLLLFVSTLARRKHFPEHFKFGVATASYQIEGGWDEDGKTPNIWDTYTHEKPERTIDRSNGDVATDSYHLYMRDVEMLKELGVHFYRFSLSWSRLLPSGFINIINQKAYKYYSDLIDELLIAGIQPYVTMYHWDLPQKLQDLGGWTNPMMVQYFEDYASVVFDLFGDRVKTWITFNEPTVICNEGYGGVTAAPAHNSTGIGNYQCFHNLIRAHASAYRLYKRVHSNKQSGRVGMTVSANWIEPLTSTEEDQIASEDALEFSIGMLYDPLIFGDYPKTLKKRVALKSRMQKFPRSRLPVFTNKEQLYLKNSVDFLGINFYTANYAYRNGSEKGKYIEPSFYDDLDVGWAKNSSWPKSASDWLRVTPWALRKVLNWVKRRYDNREILILENGFSTQGGLQDEDRINYLTSHIEVLLDAMLKDDCNVTAYTHWSLLDNFEWTRGYTEKFGLYEVDFKHPNKTRTPRQSVEIFKNIIKNNAIYTAKKEHHMSNYV